MLYAHAATKVIAEGGDLQDGQAVTEAVRSTTFEGFGNITVALDQNGNRIESFKVMNYVVGTAGGMESVSVGGYNKSSSGYLAYEQAVIWPGGTTNVPVDISTGV